MRRRDMALRASQKSAVRPCGFLIRQGMRTKREVKSQKSEVD
jgi:hypothetical protein